MSRLSARSVAITATVVLSALVVSGPALADEQVQCSKPPGAQKYVCKIVKGSGGGRGRGDQGSTPQDPNALMRAEYCARRMKEGAGIPAFCFADDLVRTPTATATPAELAQQLWPLQPPEPDVRTAPPIGSDAAVGVSVWVWVDEAQWRPIKKRRAIGAVWAEVVATPKTITIQPGDGRTITCTGPATAYRKGRTSDCTFKYLRSSAHQPGSAFSLRVTVTWTGAWTGSGNSMGVLPDLTTERTVPVRVAEGQALN